MIGFLSLSVLVTVLAVACVVVPLLRQRGNGAPVAALITALALPVVVMLSYVVVSDFPWSAPRDAAGWVSLGDGYLAQERYQEARDAYRRAVSLDGGADDDTLMSFAEASVLADSSELQGEAGRVIDDMLERNPLNPRALWYGGMTALARGETAKALDRWNRLLQLSPPPAVREILEEQMAALGEAPARDAAPGARAGPEPVGTLPVRIRIAPGLRGRVDATATLFLIARAPGGTGPPVAVVRRQALPLPAEMEISDRDSMLPGQTLGGLEAVQLTARRANGGGAIAAAGDIYGDALWRRGSSDSLPVEIMIDKVVN